MLAALGSSADGLTSAEAARRLARDGPNRVPGAPPVSALRVLLDQGKSVVVLLLVAAIAVSLAIGDWLECAAIAVVLAINTLLGFALELRARRAIEALSRLGVGRAAVLRGGRLEEVDAASLVCGDVFELRPGQTIPADGRVLVSHDLRVVEAALTGESLPIAKSAGATLPSDTPLGDRVNMVYKGTMLAAGTGQGVVTATAQATEIGRIGTLVAQIAPERTPLERRLDALGRRLVWLALGVAALVAGLGAWQGAPAALVLELGIALAVAAVPESLPAVATIALAVGVHRMVRRNALVRRLPSVESLGATTVVCTDKTRTLTSGAMSVVEVWVDGAASELSASGESSERRSAVRRVLQTAALASLAQSTGDADAGGDPVDRAILAVAGTPPHPPAHLLPFTSERGLLAAHHVLDGRVVACVKGAPRRVLALCARRWSAAGEVALDDAGREALLGANEQLAGRALRVLAVARGEVRGVAETELCGLVFLGFVGLMDPPAPGVSETIAKLRGAGLRTVMLTGDQRLTAETIGRSLGLALEGSRSLDGRELDRLDDDALRERVADTAVFSRISPEHKLRIVGALQARGEIVAMLGDGVNDAPALRRADVGVAMGRRGTDVAREAADIVLQDDRFETIAAAVEEGRVIRENVRKFVFYLFSCNVAEVLVLLGAGLASLPHPLTPLQILWLNLVTDTFPALALAVEPADHDVMRRPPRDPGEALLSRRFLASIALYGGLITSVTLASFVLTLPTGVDRARTDAFMTLALAQILHLGTARSSRPVLRPSRVAANRWAIGAVVLSVAFQLAALHLAPFPTVLVLAPLSAADWARIVGLALVPALVGQTLRWARTRP